MRAVILLAFLMIAVSGMADVRVASGIIDVDSLRLQRDLLEYEKAVGKHRQLLAQITEEDSRRLRELREDEKTLRLQAELLAQVGEETSEGELRQLQKAQKAYQQAQEGYKAEQRAMETRKRKHLDQLRTLKLLELLDLDEDQELKFIHVFQAMRRTHRKLQTERNEIIEEMSQSLSDNSVTAAQVTRALDKIDELASKDNAAKRRFHNQADAILSAEQMGKLIVFHAKFEHQILNQLREFRGRGMRGHQRGQNWEPSGKGERSRRFDNF